MPSPTAAETLREAATKLRTALDPLKTPHPQYERLMRDLDWPQALAVWLDAAAEVVEANDAHDGFDPDAIDGTYQGAVSTARAILRAQP